MLVRAIVPGENKEKAFVNAENVFQDLVEQGYFNDYNIEYQDSKVVSVDSPQGRKLIEESLALTRKDFDENLKKVKDILSKATDDELFEESGKAKLFRYYCYCLGQYAGPYVWIYDRYGEGITSETDLNFALEKEKDDEKLWIVLSDVHY